MTRKRAIVVGCGFGGLAAAQELAHKAGTSIEVIAFNRTPVLYNYPVLPRLLLADIEPSLIDKPLQSLFNASSITLRAQKVESIDPERAEISTSEEALSYDYLIFAPGGRAIPIDQDDGFAVYYPKAARHLIRLREELTALCARTTDRNRVHRFAVVGGGLTGIEFAASLRIATHRLCHRHRRDPNSVTVSLFEQRERIAPACHPRLSEKLTRLLNQRHINVETGCRAERVASDHLITHSGKVPADRVLCCVGSKPDLRLSLTNRDGNRNGLQVLPTLQHVDWPNVFIVGDAINSDAPLHQETKRASHAMRQGRAAAQNVLRLARGANPLPYRHPVLPTLVSLGLDYALLEYRGFCVGGTIPARIKHHLETRF